MEKLIAKLEKGQQEHALSDGKFKHVPHTKDGEDEYSITEYVAPNGNGYQIIFYKEEGGEEFWKSIGYGPEAKDRTYDWCNIKDL